MGWLGKKLGKYELRRELGRGGMGTVFAAAQEGLKREVALKVLTESTATPDSQKRFLREASVCARLSHPSVVRVFDYGCEQGAFYYAMELLEGTGLDQILSKQPVQPANRIAAVAGDLLAAFDHFHPQGVVHRDVKPSNIIVTDGGRAVLTDFGLVKDLAATAITRADEIVGSPQYISPEMFAGNQVGAVSDIYQLGIVLYRMAAGRLPYLGDTFRTLMEQVLEGKAVHVASLSRELQRPFADLIMKCMARQPDERFQSAREALEALAAVGFPLPADTGRVEATAARAARTPPGTPDQKVRSSRRTLPAAAPPVRAGRRAPVAAVAVSFALLAAGGAWMTWRAAQRDLPSGPGTPVAPAAAAAPSASAPFTHDELAAAVSELAPTTGALALDERLRGAQTADRPALVLAAATRAASSRLASLLAQAQEQQRNLLPPDMMWAVRTQTSRQLFDVLHYDLVLRAWSSPRDLRWREALSRTLTFHHQQVEPDEHSMSPAKMSAHLARTYPKARMSVLVSNNDSGDSYSYENARQSYIPEFLPDAIGSAFDTGDALKLESRLEPFELLAGPAPPRFVGFVFDIDHRSAFLLRLKPAGNPEAPEMIVPMTLALPPQEAIGWFAVETRLASGALPPGRYQGRVTAQRLMSRFHARPNLRALYFVGRGGE
ncbi:MAG: serine/threonine protein kinase [Candidatus Wallbacteria bacterium]|nr:serine/threonine protein kinase [Candidatus Wallbacteria bacterium]